MKKTVLMIMMLLLTASICRADDASLKRAYTYYNQGRMVEAIEVMKEVSAENPTPGQLYFIGYAYYKLQDFTNARRYFNEAYSLKTEYDPMKGDTME